MVQGREKWSDLVMEEKQKRAWRVIKTGRRRRRKYE